MATSHGYNSHRVHDCVIACQGIIIQFLSNIPDSPAYGVCVSQSIRYLGLVRKYEDFLFRRSILVQSY